MEMVRRVLVVEVVDVFDTKDLSLRFSQFLEQRQKFCRLLLSHVRQCCKVPSGGHDNLPHNRIRSILMGVKVRGLDDGSA